MNSSPGAWRRRSARVVPVADVVAAPEPGAPPDVATRHADGEALLAELARLPRRAQAVLVLRYYEGLSDAEIAELLGCRPATVSQVHGEPAWFQEDGGHGIAFLYWEYAPDSMAVLSLRHPDAPLSDFLAIAEAITFVDPYPARLPLRLDYVPADLRPTALILGQLNARAILSFANDIGDVEPEAAHPREVTIQLLDHRPAPGELMGLGDERKPRGPWGPPTNVGAHSVRCVQAPAGLNYDDARTCEIEVQGDVVIIDFFELTATEIEQLIAGLTVADPADPTTWFSSLDALP